MDKKTAVYICSGCGIGDAVDMEKLGEVATGEQGVALCKTHPFLCGAEGVALMKKDMEGEGVNTIVIAACSGRVNYDVFNFGSDKIVERVNIREHVAWSQPPKEEDTQMLAEDLMRMGCAKAKDTDLPVPFKAEEPYSKRLLVVGGGLAGMSAALESAQAGYEAVLVEKEGHLGGWLARNKKRITSPYKDLTDTGIEDLVKAVESDSKIKVYKGAGIEEIAGGPGLFSVKIKTNGTGVEEKVGAVVQATGWVPYDAKKLGHLGYGKFKDVVTNVELEKMAASGKIQRPSNGQERALCSMCRFAGP